MSKTECAADYPNAPAHKFRFLVKEVAASALEDRRSSREGVTSLEKECQQKDDGRYIIFYIFDYEPDEQEEEE